MNIAHDRRICRKLIKVKKIIHELRMNEGYSEFDDLSAKQTLKQIADDEQGFSTDFIELTQAEFELDKILEANTK